MFGATMVSDWKEGSPIVWKGEWKGQPFEDKGHILDLRPEERLRYTHFSPLSEVPDDPENYHQVTIELSKQDGQDDNVRIELSQDNNKTAKARDESQRNWATRLHGIRRWSNRRRRADLSLAALVMGLPSSGKFIVSVEEARHEQG